MADPADLIAERQTTHGDYAEYARLCQALKEVMHGSRNWNRLSAPSREGLEQIQGKIARFLTGDPSHPDHTDDIVGYGVLVRDHPKTM